MRLILLAVAGISMPLSAQQRHTITHEDRRELRRPSHQLAGGDDNALSRAREPRR
ncbi:MAG TPA: hypothetical protein VKQ05_06980 [Gemmatimonadales bacterium]|nr:hypothetical protein [Gemmatimonadales bacterium]